MKQSLAVIAMALAFVLSSQAQLASDPAALGSATPHVHDNAMRMIDGASHPELIPDLTAYRLFFVSVANSANASEEEKHRHRAYLNKIHLGEADATSLVDVMTSFGKNYESLIQKYNDSVKSAIARDEVPDVGGFLAERDALVQGFRDSLKSVLTSEGNSRLERFVQSEKRNIKMQR